MFKTSYIITLLSGIGFFNSCTGNFINLPEHENKAEFYQNTDTAYGNYLAGRIAHIRQDYNKAAEYYIKTMDKGIINAEILGRTYIILASQGKIDEAVKKLHESGASSVRLIESC
jgi:hypothetical protein